MELRNFDRSTHNYPLPQMSQRAAADSEEIIRGTVKRVTYRNSENGYSVIQIAVADQREQITVVGNCLETKVGSHVVIRGSFKEHPKFGRQLSAHSITETTPSSPDELQRYLSSGLIKGIGAKTAERIVSALGEQTIEVILRDPEKLAKIPGLGESKARIIVEAFSSQQETREIMQFLVEHKISLKLATKIYEKYRGRSVEVLSKDPYLLARDLRGVGFIKADEIALNMGLKPDSPQRLKAGLYYALEKASDEGHCYLPLKSLHERAGMLLGLDQQHDLMPLLEELIRDNYIVSEKIEDREEQALFLQHLWRAEDFTARFIAARCQAREVPIIENEQVSSCLQQAARELGISFSFEQAHAVELATQYPLLIITGGPGCGKTTIIKALSLLFRQANKRLLMAAPTGRAAQRMAQVCQYPSSTIHRLLKFDPQRARFVHGINDPLPADAIIIDEASMLDIQLAKDLFSAIPAQATLILVGDKDQLPSVGPGRVFGDLVSVAQVKTISLSTLFRRAEESSINTIAHAINSGITPEIPEPDGVTKVDAYFIAKTDTDLAGQTIESLVADQIPRKFNIAANDICVLTPSNRGPLGTLALNQRLQNRINPLSALDPEQEIRVSDDICFRLGDRVCQRVNNYNIDLLGVFNGDVGQVYSVNQRERTIQVEMWDGRLIKYYEADFGQLSLAYAITVHRSQGSEIPCVVLALHESHFTLLERQLIYTAVTRAKKLLIIVGSRKALMLAARRQNARRRCTLLRQRVSKLIS